MKQENDLFTGELSLPRRRGRQRIFANDSDRVKASRLRSGKVLLSVSISWELKQKLDAFMFNERLGVRSETKSQVVERALNQFFRKR
jgi:hypothetical protein